MLEVQDLKVTFGAVTAFEGVNLQVGEREIVALAGHNGAGKTTLFRAISGLQRVQLGTVRFDGDVISGRPPEELAQKALAFVPQGRNVFSDMSVNDNLVIARDATKRVGLTRQEIFDLFPILKEKQHDRAGSLSGGQQQMLALSIALVRGPRMILLDEPSTGLAPVLVQTVFETVQKLHKELGTSFVIIDQNVEQLMKLASRAYVLKAGRIVYDGEAAKLTGAELWKYF